MEKVYLYSLTYVSDYIKLNFFIYTSLLLFLYLLNL